MLKNLSVSDALLRKLMQQIIIKTKSGSAAVTLLISTDFFCFTLLVEGSYVAQALGDSYSLIDLESAFSAHVIFLSLIFGCKIELVQSRLRIYLSTYDGLRRHATIWNRCR